LLQALIGNALLTLSLPHHHHSHSAHSSTFHSTSVPLDASNPYLLEECSCCSKSTPMSFGGYNPLDSYNSPPRRASTPVSKQDDVAAIFAKFDPNNTGKISLQDFLDFIDELEIVRDAPILNEYARTQAQDFVRGGLGEEVGIGDIRNLIRELGGGELDAPTEKVTTPQKNIFESSPLKNSPMSLGTARPRSGMMSQIPRKPKGRNQTSATIGIVGDEGIEGFSAIQLPGYDPSTPQFHRQDSSPIGHSTPLHMPSSPPIKSPDYYNDLAKRLKESERQNQILMSSQESRIHELEAQVDQLEWEIKERKRELTEGKAKERQLGLSVSRLEGEIVEATRDAGRWKDKYNVAKNRVDEQVGDIQKVQDFLAKKEEEIRQLQSRYESLQDELQDAQNDARVLRQRISHLEDENSRIPSLQTDLREQKTRFRDLEDENKKLRNDLEEMKAGSFRGLRHYKSVAGLPTDLASELRAQGSGDDDGSDEEITTETVTRTARRRRNKSEEKKTMIDCSIQVQPETSVADTQCDPLLKLDSEDLAKELDIQKNIIDSLVRKKLAAKRKRKSASSSPVPPESDRVTLALMMYSLTLLVIAFGLTVLWTRWREQRIYAFMNEHTQYHHGRWRGRRWWEGGPRWIECLGWLVDGVAGVPT
ncbi:Karyogamy meiotic segregation protein 2, partial [Neolecta irregularis DAH-3]